MGGAVPIIRQAGEGERLWFAGGGIFTMKASAADTDGALFLFEDEMVRGKTTPLHLHPNEDEVFWLIDGEVLVHVDGEEHLVGQGGFAFLPRGVPHAFLVTSETARMIAFQTPGTGEAFYNALTEPVSSAEDEARSPDFDRLRAVAEESDSIVLLGPPPFESVTSKAHAPSAP